MLNFFWGGYIAKNLNYLKNNYFPNDNQENISFEVHAIN